MQRQTENAARSRRTWSAGNFARIGAFSTHPAERLVEEVGLTAGSRVLDIACGSGPVALAAARRLTTVTGMDIVPELLEHARRRAEVDNLEVEFIEGDAENLPFPDNSFDFVLSQYGVMFASDQERAAAEMLRVCRPGGVIGLSCWPPMSAPGAMFRLSAEFNPNPQSPAHPPIAWGTGPRLRELLGAGCNQIRVVDASFRQRFPSFDFYVELFSSYFGPMNLLKSALPPERWDEYVARLRTALALYNRATDGTFDLANEYIMAIAQRKN